jgi:hypothetical protein
MGGPAETDALTNSTMKMRFALFGAIVASAYQTTELPAVAVAEAPNSPQAAFRGAMRTCSLFRIWLG